MSAGLTSQSKPGWTHRALVAASLLAAATAVALLGWDTFRDKSTTPLTIRRGDLDFGRVWARSDFHWTLPVVNRSERTIAVERVLVSCSCTEVQPERFSLAPGASQNLDLLLNLAPQSGSIKNHVDPFEVAVDLRDGSGRRLGVWRLHGIVQHPFRGATDIAFFGSSKLIENVPPVDGQTTLYHFGAVTKIIPGNHSFPGTVNIEQDGNRGSSRVTLHPADDLTVGKFAYEIPLIAVQDDGTRLPSIPLRVRGIVDRDVTTVPATLRLPPTRLGESCRMAVQLTSQSGLPFQVTEATSETDGITLILLDESRPEGPIYELRKTITEIGDSSDRIRFAYLRSDGSGGSLILPVSSFGRQPHPKPAVSTSDI